MRAWKKNWWMVAAALCTALVWTGCGDDDDDGGTPTTDGGTSMGDTDGGGTTGDTIVDVAAGSDDFEILVAAVQRAGLAGTLSSAGPFTVFAPTDDAFEGAGLDMDAIMATPPEDLEQILLYHVLGTEVLAADVTDGPRTTAAELSIILGTEGGVTINGGADVEGGATVVTPDIDDPSNGVIHAINGVLLPPTVADLARYAGLTELADAVEAEATIAAALIDESADLTVFAPTNEAFPDDTTGLDVPSILLYHTLSQRVLSSEISDGMAADTQASVSFEDGGDTREYALDVFFDTSDGVAINGGSGDEATNLGGNVVIADVIGTNGVVHVIDGVLLPLSIAEIAQVAGFDQLVAAVVASDPIPASIAGSETPVLDALSGDGLAPLTVFAPTDEAFGEAFPSGLPDDGGAILGVLGLHVIPLPLPVLAENLPGDTSTMVPPLAGSDLTFDAAATPPTVSVSGGGSTAAIGPTDLGATNGVVHVIDTVLTE